MIYHDMFPEKEYYQKAIFLGNTAASNPPKVVGLPKKEEGNNPMRYDDMNVTVNPAVTVAAPVDPAVAQRKYLTDRLNEAYRSFDYGNKFFEMRKDFNIGAPGTPVTYKELIDAIKNGKYTLDEKRVKQIERNREEFDEEEIGYIAEGPFDGIIFTDFPKPDREGFAKAQEAVRKMYQDTKDTIAIADPKEGLEALRAFEAWWPTKDTDTAQ